MQVLLLYPILVSLLLSTFQERGLCVAASAGHLLVLLDLGLREGPDVSRGGVNLWRDAVSMGALRSAYTIKGVPYCSCSMIYPKSYSND